MTLRLDYITASDRGLVRGNNEDSAYAGPHLLVLADGMGGHAAGEVASQIMVTHLERLDVAPGDNDMLALLAAAAEDANVAIAEEVDRRPETQGMGSTLTALMFNGSEFGMCHVGDSRGYRLRDGQLQQITVDDTYVQRLVEEGKLAAEDVSTHPMRSMILKAYTGRPVEPTLVHLDARPGDRLLLCSDGLSDPVSFDTISEHLGVGSPADAAQRLIELALRSGGPDNVTVVVADVVDEEDVADPASLPTEPATAGALLGDPEEESHPDTAAGRAAALRAQQARETEQSPEAENAKPQQQFPSGGPHAGEQPDGESYGEAEQDGGSDDAEGSGRGRTWRWVSLIVSLVVVLVLLVGTWWVWMTARDNYFISIGDEDSLVVENGVNFSVFGHDLHQPYQYVCLGADGAVRTVDLEDAGSCSLFTLEDLPEAARSQVDAWSSGSYDAVTQQLQRLGSQALPICVSTTTEDGETETDPERTTQHGRATPGVDCRVVADPEQALAADAEGASESATPSTAAEDTATTAASPSREEAQQ